MKNEKAEKAVDEDDLLLCSLTSDSEKDEEKKKVLFVENVKKPAEAVMLCTINRETFHLFMKII